MAQNRKRPPRRTGQRPQQRAGSSSVQHRTRSGTAGPPHRPAAYEVPYDQTQEMRRTPQRTGSGSSGNYGYGQTIDFASGRQRRPDNSIEFPQSARRPNPNGSAARSRPRNASGQTRPRNGAARPDPNRKKNAQRRPPNGRLRPTEATLHDPNRRERRKKRKLTRAAIRRRRIMRRLTAFALLLCVIAVGIYLTVTMLFKISAIQVQTADGTVVQEAGGYASDQILQALDVHLEENIFSFDPGKKAKELEKIFPMLEFIRVERDYPGTVVVRVTEAQPAYAMQVKGGWLCLSASLKILNKQSEQPEGLPTLYGGEPVSSTPGDQLAFEAEAVSTSESGSESAASSEAAAPEDDRLESLHTLMDALESRGLLADVTRIEFADTEEMAFLYQNRISVLLGTLNELDYKLKMAEYVLLNQDGKGCAPTDTGLLDLSHLSASTTRKFRFAQGDPELPSGYVVPEQTTVPEETTPSTEAEAGTEEAGAAPADAADQTTPAPEAGTEAPAADGTDTQNTDPQ